MKKRKIPMRMCVGCREMKPKKELIRVVKSPDDSILLDAKGKAPGRGAYICHNMDCLNKAIKSKILEKSFDRKIDEHIYIELKEQMNEGELH